MKHALTAIALTLSLAASPVLAFYVDMSTLTPTLTFPEPAPSPVIKDRSGFD